jgi:hypothetical protein
MTTREKTMAVLRPFAKYLSESEATLDKFRAFPEDATLSGIQLRDWRAAAALLAEMEAEVERGKVEWTQEPVALAGQHWYVVATYVNAKVRPYWDYETMWLEQGATLWQNQWRSVNTLPPPPSSNGNADNGKDGE